MVERSKATIARSWSYSRSGEGWFESSRRVPSNLKISRKRWKADFLDASFSCGCGSQFSSQFSCQFIVASCNQLKSMLSNKDLRVKKNYYYYLDTID